MGLFLKYKKHRKRLLFFRYFAFSAAKSVQSHRSLAPAFPGTHPCFSKILRFLAAQESKNDTQSCFNLQFTKHVDMPPNKYRKNYIVQAEPPAPKSRKKTQK